jgi:hypothetical protein
MKVPLAPLIYALRFLVKLHHFVWISPGLRFYGHLEIELKSIKVLVPLSPSLGHDQPWSGIKTITWLISASYPFHRTYCCEDWATYGIDPIIICWSKGCVATSTGDITTDPLILRSSSSTVHSEYATLSVQWPGKLKKMRGGGGFDFIFLGGFDCRR